MPRKKKSEDVEIPNPLRVDEAEFTEVIRKMVNTSPVTREEVEGREQKRRKIERRKNPETDPRYLPVFDFHRPDEKEKWEIFQHSQGKKKKH